MKKSELIKKLKEIKEDVDIELQISDRNNNVHFAGVERVVVSGRDPTMKTIRLFGSKRY